MYVHVHIHIDDDDYPEICQHHELTLKQTQVIIVRRTAPCDDAQPKCHPQVVENSQIYIYNAEEREKNGQNGKKNIIRKINLLNEPNNR